MKISNTIRKIAKSSFGEKIVQFVGGKKIMANLHVRSMKKDYFAEAKHHYENGSFIGEFDDYKRALAKHWVSYSEWAYQYEFYKKSEKERKEFISRLKMRYFYMCYCPYGVKSQFGNKKIFLETFKNNIHRKWLYAPEVSFCVFDEMVSNYDCIIKPYGGTLGKGVFKTLKNSGHNDNKKLYEFCVKERMLVEECIESCEELKAFHPQSLNTLRIVTISGNSKADIIGGFFRMGVGNSIIDNAHAGGVFAQIDIENGVIVSDGIDVNGNRFLCHPDSRLKIKGFAIPKWESIVDDCCKAALQTNNPITGWDVVINNCGNVEFIEGNSTPDFDVMQSPLQIGVKKRLYFLIKEYCGINLK